MRYELNRLRYISLLKYLRDEFSQTTRMASYMHIGCHEHSNTLLSEVRGFSPKITSAGPICFCSDDFKREWLCTGGTQ